MTPVKVSAATRIQAHMRRHSSNRLMDMRGDLILRQRRLKREAEDREKALMATDLAETAVRLGIGDGFKPRISQPDLVVRVQEPEGSEPPQPRAYGAPPAPQQPKAPALPPKDRRKSMAKAVPVPANPIRVVVRVRTALAKGALINTTCEPRIGNHVEMT